MKKLRFVLLDLSVSLSFAAVILRAGVPVQIGQNFVGGTFDPTAAISPADADGAVGLQHFVELINGHFSVYDKSTGHRVQTMTDIQFWKAAGVSVASTLSFSDPRMIFDSASQRWFASMIDARLGSTRQPSNHFHIAISQT